MFLLDVIKTMASFFVVFCIIYFLCKSVCSIFKISKKTIRNVFYLDDIVSVVSSLIITLTFFTF